MEEQKYKVYVYTNKINEKKYVGQTGKSLSVRAGKDGRGYEGCTYFWRAIQKYGWNNFEPQIVHDNLTKDEADKLEIQLISSLKSSERKYGYNIALGGSSTANPNKKIPVVQFDLEFNYIDRHDSMKEAEFKTGVSSSHIKQVCVHECAQASGFIWLFEEDYYSGNYDKEHILYLINKEFEHPDSRPVVQCDLNMNFIARYKNISEASRQTGVWRSGISENCGEYLKTSGGFIWFYEENYEQNKNNKEEIAANAKNSNHKKYPVLQFDLEGNLITSFPSLLEASKITGVDRKSIAYVCEEKYNQAGGYIWRKALNE